MNLDRRSEQFGNESINLVAGLIELPGVPGVLALHISVSDVFKRELHLE